MGCMAKRLEQRGAKRITVMANSACDIRFGSAPPPRSATDRKFDVVFISSRPGGRNVTKHLYWSVRRRLGYVDLLEKRYGERFALFGRGGPATDHGKAPLISTSRRLRLSEPE